MDRREAIRTGIVAAPGLLGMVLKGDPAKTTHEHDMSRGRLPYGELTAGEGIANLVDEIFLDGRKIMPEENCFRVNEVEGWIDCYCPFPAIVRVTGRVELTFRKV